MSFRRKVSGSVARLAPGTSWPLLVAALIVIALGTAAVHTLADSDDLVEQRWRHTETLLGVERLVGTLADAESGQRGYLITGKPAYLEPYTEAGRRLSATLADLENALAEQPDQLARLLRLRPLIKENLAELARTIELRREGRMDEVHSMVGTDQGRFNMARIREEARKLSERADALREERNREYISSSRRSFLVVVGGSAILFVLTAFATMTTARELRARALAELAARRRGERYRSLVDASSQVIWTADRDGLMSGEQPGWSDLTGQPPQDAAGLGWIAAVHPEDREKTRALWAAAVTKRAVLGIEHRVRRTDGTWGTFAVRAVPVQDEAGSTREWVGVHTDITENKRAEERLRFLAEVSTLFASQLDLDTALARVAALSVPAFADWCVIDVLGPGQPPTRVAVAFADPARAAQAEDLRRHPPESDEPGGIAEVLRTGQACLCSSVPAGHWQGVISDPKRQSALEVLGIRSFIMVPLRARGRVTGVLTWGCAESGRRFGPEDLAFGREVASRTGTAIDRVRLLAETNDALERELKAGRATEEARRLLDAIFEAAPVGLALLDRELRFTRINAALAEISGRSEASHIGQSVASVFANVQPPVADLLAQVRDLHRPLEQEVQGKTAGSTDERFWLLRCSPADGVGVIAALIDLTDRKLAESERERLVRALAKSNQDLNEFAYVASHDLKAPLRGITHLSEWLEEDIGSNIPAAAREKLHLLRGRARRLEGLIEGILNYSRAGRADTGLALVDVRGLLREVVDLLGKPALESVHVAETPWPALTTEKAALEQVFMNLISNALKHAGGDGLRIEVSAERAEDRWQFSVADNGPGIAAEYHDRVWGIFQMLQARDKVEGAGIGLAIVKKIVESKGGRAWIVSAPGAGAQICFTWPQHEGPQA